MATAKQKGTKPDEPKARLSDRIEIAAPRYDVTTVEVYGVSDLIQERFPEKARIAIEGKHAGAAKGPRELRKPEEEYEALKYKLPDGRDAIKSAAFQEAAIWTANSLDGLNGKRVKSAMRVLDDLIPILGFRIKGGKIVNTPHAEVRMVRDTGKDAKGGFRLMYRPYYNGWRVRIRVRHRPEMLSSEQIVNLLNHAGFSSGVGAHRPSSPKKSGPHGMFTASAEQALAFLRDAQESAS